jgi:hypothetical protein
MTHDGFQPDRPVFLSEHATDEQDIAKADIGRADSGKAWDIELISSRILKACILVATVPAVGIAVLSIENPASLVANLADWASDKPALQADADPPASTIRSIAISATRDLPTTTTADAPTREEIAAAAEPVGQSQPAEPSQFTQQSQPAQQSQLAQQSQPVQQSEAGEPVTEALFKQFQAWAAEEEARTTQPAQAAPVRVAQDAPAHAAKKHRQARPVQNARAEIRSQRNHRAKAREEQGARGQVPPTADPRLQDPPVQNAQPPSLLQSLGLSSQ